MIRRTLAFCAISCAAVSPLSFMVMPAGASPANPGIHLSTTVLIPGKTLVITGRGWTPRASVEATICGADAVSGTVDCAATSTATMGATSRGLLWSHIQIVVPPAPCPCVVLVTGAGTTFTEKIPVQVVGAPVGPLRPAPQVAPPTVRISGLRVSGHPTLFSLFGARAPRTIEFRLRNTGDQPVTPVVIGRWGAGRDLPNVIEMPHLGSLAPGQSRYLRVPVSLTALSLGSYQVMVRVQLVGFPGQAAASAATTQWPIGLFVVALLAVLAIAYLLVARRRRASEEAGPAQSVGTGSTGGEVADVPPVLSEPQGDLSRA